MSRPKRTKCEKHNCELHIRPNGRLVCKACINERHKIRRSSVEGKAKQAAEDRKRHQTAEFKEKRKEFRQRPEEKAKHAKRERRLRAERKKDPAYRLRIRISNSVRDLLRKQDLSKFNKSILDHLQYSIEDLKKHLEAQFESWMNWDNWGFYRLSEWDDNDPKTWKWQIDHIIPQSILKFQSMTDDNFKKCWALENLRPLLAKTNILKGNKVIKNEILFDSSDLYKRGK